MLTNLLCPALSVLFELYFFGVYFYNPCAIYCISFFKHLVTLLNRGLSITVCIRAARTVALQSFGSIASAGQIGNIGVIPAKNIPAMTGMKIAVAPAWAGLGLGTAAHVTGLAGATAGGIAIAENNSNNGHAVRSPVTP